ncbi:hypothetical protein B0H15DRAFT_806791 [Mycena belliarum]|uniref:Uncharacterized protein n=1 Tax=Mycena belliarum TaxID=1033014 RepID=A0AAD6TQE9_9AGAR|nr:hypothetical protein B0H15DRAFT_806791 [Mycena belliae]
MSLWYFLNLRERGSSSAGGLSCTVLMNRSLGPTESSIPTQTLPCGPSAVPLGSAAANNMESSLLAGVPSLPAAHQSVALLEQETKVGGPSTSEREHERPAFRSTPSFRLDETLATRRTSKIVKFLEGHDENSSDHLGTRLHPTKKLRIPKDRLTNPDPVPESNHRSHWQKNNLPCVYGVKSSNHVTVWYCSTEADLVEPPIPRADQAVQAGELFLNTSNGETAIWIRTGDNQSWQSIKVEPGLDAPQPRRPLSPRSAVGSWSQQLSKVGNNQADRIQWVAVHANVLDLNAECGAQLPLASVPRVFDLVQNRGPGGPARKGQEASKQKATSFTPRPAVHVDEAQCARAVVKTQSLHNTARGPGATSDIRCRLARGHAEYAYACISARRQFPALSPTLDFYQPAHSCAQQYDALMQTHLGGVATWRGVPAAGFIKYFPTVEASSLIDDNLVSGPVSSISFYTHYPTFFVASSCITSPAFPHPMWYNSLVASTALSPPPQPQAQLRRSPRWRCPHPELLHEFERSALAGAGISIGASADFGQGADADPTVVRLRPWQACARDADGGWAARVAGVCGGNVKDNQGGPSLCASCGVYAAWRGSGREIATRKRRSGMGGRGAVAGEGESEGEGVEEEEEAGWAARAKAPALASSAAQARHPGPLTRQGQHAGQGGEGSTGIVMGLLGLGRAVAGGKTHGKQRGWACVRLRAVHEQNRNRVGSDARFTQIDMGFHDTQLAFEHIVIDIYQASCTSCDLEM